MIRRIIITGSRGMIGRHLLAECQERWPAARILKVDIADNNDCRKFFAEDEGVCELAIHCAAQTGGIEGTTYRSAELASRNMQMDGAFFEWALRVKPRRAIYFSSSCAYTLLPPGDERLLREDDIDIARGIGGDGSTYGHVKFLGEIVADSVRNEGAPVSVVRPFAVYSEDQETCRMIPKFVERALSDSETFEVWGEGNQASDFIHVDDVVQAIFAMIDNDIDGPLNLGTGIGTTVDEAARIVMEAAGIDRPIIHNTSKPSGPRWRVANPALLESIHTPKISLEEGIQRAIAFRR